MTWKLISALCCVDGPARHSFGGHHFILDGISCERPWKEEQCFCGARTHSGLHHSKGRAQGASQRWQSFYSRYCRTGHRGLTKMPSQAARVKSRVDAVARPKVWLLITMGPSVMERVSAPTWPSTIPLL